MCYESLCCCLEKAEWRREGKGEGERFDCKGQLGCCESWETVAPPRIAFDEQRRWVCSQREVGETAKHQLFVRIKKSGRK